MKRTILLIMFTTLMSLTYSQQPIPKYDSLYKVYRLQKVNDSLEIQYLNYKIERARYYVKICNKNKSQQKFLLGWLNRALK